MANSVINEILRQGRRQPKRYVLAALTTGRVESNFRNVAGGHGDSQGWRQERASLYPNPRNLRASVRRFYREAAQHDRGQKVGELAADVQRPAAQYRGRYAAVLPEAKQILRSRGTVTGGATGGGGASAFLRLASGQTSDLTGLLSSLGGVDRPRPSVTPPAAPAFSAQAPMPQTYQPIDTTQIERADSDYQAALGRLSELSQGGSFGNLIGVRGRGGLAGEIGRLAGGRTGKVRISAGADRAGVRTAPEVVQFVRGVAGIAGRPLTIGTGSAHSKYTVNGNVSAHWSGKAADIPLMGRPLVRAGRAALVAAGMSPRQARKAKGGLFNVGDWQIIFNTQEGGDHSDHLHVGRRR